MLATTKRTFARPVSFIDHVFCPRIPLSEKTTQWSTRAPFGFWSASQTMLCDGVWKPASIPTAPAAGASTSSALQVAAKSLLTLYRFEEGLEVALAERRRAVALDHLEEDRRAVLRGLREDLEQVS